MEYISTRNTQKTFSFKDVFLKGLAPDGGLFVPKKIPLYTSQELEKLRNLSYNSLATKIILKFCSDEFNEIEIKDLVKNSYKNFRVNDVVMIKKLGKVNLLELFHGPTLAFKDIAMQVIGNMYEKILLFSLKIIGIFFQFHKEYFLEKSMFFFFLKSFHFYNNPLLSWNHFEILILI